MLQGADVDFQDYNEEVLKEVCCLNVLVNCPKTPRVVRYFSGDWGTLAACTGKVYDVILTAETIYDDKSSGRLIACIDDILKPDGVAYIAAKSYYFGDPALLLFLWCNGGAGVGGSTRQFEAQVSKLLPKRNVVSIIPSLFPTLSSSSPFLSQSSQAVSFLMITWWQDGSSNVREILRLSPEA
eukprot:746968-Hanusia_phi.AAC.5